jgi:hypothetical protein
MKFAVYGLALMAVMGLTACANNPNRPTDTGSMQTPTPRSSGYIGTSQPTGRDVGSMQTPSNTNGSGLRASPEALGNMGSMQAPANTQGNLRGRVQ